MENEQDAEFKQEYYLLESINNLLKTKTDDLLELKNQLEIKLQTKEKSLLELAQEKTLLNRINEKLERQLQGSSDTSSDYDESARVYELVKIFKEISYDRLKQITSMDDEIKPIISQLRENEKISAIEKIREPSCPECKWLLLEPVFCCPKCKKDKHTVTTLLEHFDCGNVSSEDSYTDDKCPSCNKPLKAMGVDYRKLPNRHRCHECSELFPDPEMNLKCLQCKAQFSAASCNWNESKGFKISL